MRLQPTKHKLEASFDLVPTDGPQTEQVNPIIFQIETISQASEALLLGGSNPRSLDRSRKEAVC